MDAAVHDDDDGRRSRALCDGGSAADAADDTSSAAAVATGGNDGDGDGGSDIIAAGGKPEASWNLDGVDLRPHLTGEKSEPPHTALYWRLGPQKAIRQGRWKLVDWRDFTAKKQSGWQLYDLHQDVSESDDLAAKNPAVVAELSQAWDRWNAKNIAPLWQGSSTEDPSAPEFRPLQKK